MNWKKVPPVILSCALGFLTGALLGGFSGRAAGEGQMLAGGAIAVFHMLIGGLVCLGLAGYLSWNWPAGRLWKLALGLALSTGLLVMLTNYVVTQKRAAKEAAQQELSEQRSGLPLPEREPKAGEVRKGLNADSQAINRLKFRAQNSERGFCSMPRSGFCALTCSRL